MMAWDIDGTLWDDSVDWVCVRNEMNNGSSEETFVMTTWHDNFTLKEVLHFAKYLATLSYLDEPLKDFLILDLTHAAREEVIIGLYNSVTKEDY